MYTIDSVEVGAAFFLSEALENRVPVKAKIEAMKSISVLTRSVISKGIEDGTVIVNEASIDIGRLYDKLLEKIRREGAIIISLHPIGDVRLSSMDISRIYDLSVV